MIVLSKEAKLKTGYTACVEVFQKQKIDNYYHIFIVCRSMTM